VGFETRHVAADISGYSGPINLWVRFDAEGTLEQVVLRHHQETPSYIRGVPAWLGLLEGRRLSQPFTGPHGVDALSGATVTTEAIGRILERSRARVAGDLLGLTPPTGVGGSPSFWAQIFDGPRAWVVLGFLLLLIPLSRWGGWRARLVGLVTSFVVLGLWLNVPFAMVDVASLSYGVLPGGGGGPKVVLVLGVLGISVAFGQIWCGYGCPFGAAQELVWLIFHPRGVRADAALGGARTISPELEQRARYLKFFALTLVLCFFWISGDAAYLALDPMTSAFSSKMPGTVMVVLAVLGVISLIYFRPFCRYLCPVGAFLALFNKLALAERVGVGVLFRRRDPARCDLGVTTQGHLDCLKCNRCLVRSPTSVGSPFGSDRT
jgi:NosR/NirI family transcriptional regulator, nitrous oxide reductase regulator